MNDQKRIPSVKWAALTLGSVMLVVAVCLVFLALNPVKKVSNFNECIAAGGARMESYPEQCLYKKKTYFNEAQRMPEEPADSTNGSEYVGLLEDHALTRASTSNTPARVVERDGEGLPATMDFVYGRLNLYVRDGKVYKVEVEGQAKDAQ